MGVMAKLSPAWYLLSRVMLASRALGSCCRILVTRHCRELGMEPCEESETTASLLAAMRSVTYAMAFYRCSAGVTIEHRHHRDRWRVELDRIRGRARVRCISVWEPGRWEPLIAPLTEERFLYLDGASRVLVSSTGRQYVAEFDPEGQVGLRDVGMTTRSLAEWNCGA